MDWLSIFLVALIIIGPGHIFYCHTHVRARENGHVEERLYVHVLVWLTCVFGWWYLIPSIMKERRNEFAL